MTDYKLTIPPNVEEIIGEVVKKEFPDITDTSLDYRTCLINYLSEQYGISENDLQGIVVQEATPDTE